MSDEQRQASKKNGSQGRGPTSQRGKNNSKFNALKNGLFSNRAVIPFLGERTEDFENLKRRLLARFQPADIVVQMLVQECLVGWSRMQRIERVTASEIMNHCLQNQIAVSEKVREVASLLSKFLRLYAESVNSGPGKPQYGVVGWEMDEIRSQLKKTSFGISYLKEHVRDARTQFSRPKNHPDRTLCLIAACTGATDSNFIICNNIISQVRQKAQATQTGVGDSQPSRVPNCDIELDPLSLELLNVTLMEIEILLGSEQIVAELAEANSAKLENASSPLLPAEVADRIARAESSAERKFYRALGLLLSKESEGG